MLKQRLTQKLLQKLSPQQIQLIKLLEVPTIQLEQRIKKEIEENPVLEEGYAREDNQDSNPDESANEEQNGAEQDEFSLDDYIDDEEMPSYKLSTNNYSKDDKKPDIPFSAGSSFHEHLNRQLGLQIMTEEQKVLAEYIIGNIDGDGYLRRDLEAIVDDIAFSQNISTSESELKNVLNIIQDFDPPGVGARDLQECLLLQIDKKIYFNNNLSGLNLAKIIIKDYFNEFTKKHYDKIQNRLGIDSEELKLAMNEILKLNPKPGSSFSDESEKSLEQIIPDFMLEVNNGQIQVNLNAKNSPELRISKDYSNMIEAYSNTRKNHKSAKEKEAIMFVKQKLDSAKWFIDAIKQRQHTLMMTMNAIVEYQHDYFFDGDEKKLKPMILKDIAEKTHLDISTISRVANSKFVQTHFGIFPLKYFFSEGMKTENGEEVSTREIKKILKECIEGESKKKPLTDEKLAQILQEKGYRIARRTVAKYREQMNIPVARLRKEL